MCASILTLFYFRPCVPASSVDPDRRGSGSTSDSCSFHHRRIRTHCSHRHGDAMMSPPSRAARETFSSHTESNLSSHGDTWTTAPSVCALRSYSCRGDLNLLTHSRCGDELASKSSHFQANTCFNSAVRLGLFRLHRLNGCDALT